MSSTNDDFINRYLNDMNHDEVPDSFKQFQKDATNTFLLATIVPIVIVFAFLAVVGCILYQKRKGIRKAVVSDVREIVVARQQPQPPVQANMLPAWQVDAPTMEKFFQELAQDRPVRFNAQQIYTFTKNYLTLLGSGGYGKVYKGELPNGVKIAVKVLNRDADKGVRIEQQFMAEVGTIGRTNHFNLVKLYGFCYDQFMSALVYEFMENGSLDRHLFKNPQQLEWEKLHEIAVGTAKGLAYLHEECQQRIVHYDIKPGNVLLDANFSPKVADFGLAKLCARDATHVTVSGYRGTPGYAAPEFMLKNFPITYKCDVYSFGILLFEIVGRRRNAGAGESDGDSLDWFPKHVWEEYEKGELMELLEACEIEEQYREQANRMAMVALWCAQDTPEHRPRMSAVVKMLEGGVEIMPPPKPFHYLFSVGTNVLKVPSSGSENGSGYTTSEGTNSLWYKETTTPVMTKYEITVATL